MSFEDEILPLEGMGSPRYREALQNIPAPGTGCHPYLLTVANIGVRDKLDPAQIFEDIRINIPPGDREIDDREIEDALNKAMNDHDCWAFKLCPPVKTTIKDGKAALMRVINQGTIFEEVGLSMSSPKKIPSEPVRQTLLFLKSRFESTELLFIGDKNAGNLGKNIRSAATWIEYFEQGGQAGPFIIVNPLNGRPMPKKSSKEMTYRGDNNVEVFKHALVEFDDLAISDQIKFWSAARLPIVALIHTGGKSIHAWLDVSKLAEIRTANAWDTIIRQRLYDRLLAPLGVDKACSNPSRLSRLPGCIRDEKGMVQRLLWLSDKGRTVHEG